MLIAGLQKTTLIDFQDKIACIIFLAGCNFRCPWCYSAELVLPVKIATQPRISEKEVFDFLRQRQGLLDGVVICGGEPTVNKDLPQFLQKIKNLPFDSAQGEGFLVKLDTNGSNPKMLKDLADRKLIDYVAMDIKGPGGPNFQFPISNFQSNSNDKIKKTAYEMSLGEGITMDKINESVEFLKSGKISFEFRTTVVPNIHAKEDFAEIAKWIGGKNVTYYLQNFRPEKTIEPEFEKIQPYKNDFFEEVVKEISPYFKLCQFRG